MIGRWGSLFRGGGATGGLSTRQEERLKTHKQHRTGYRRACLFYTHIALCTMRRFHDGNFLPGHGPSTRFEAIALFSGLHVIFSGPLWFPLLLSVIASRLLPTYLQLGTQRGPARTGVHLKLGSLASAGRPPATTYHLAESRIEACPSPSMSTTPSNNLASPHTLAT